MGGSPPQFSLVSNHAQEGGLEPLRPAFYSATVIALIEVFRIRSKATISIYIKGLLRITPPCASGLV
jgi:hypothetical protein